MIAHSLLDRPTSDLDPFTPLPGGAGHVTVALQDALRAAGHHVTVNTTRATEGDYAQREVTRGEQSVQIALGPVLAPVPLAVGPVLHLDDAVGNKVVAMIGRGLPATTSMSLLRCDATTAGSSSS